MKNQNDSDPHLFFSSEKKQKNLVLQREKNQKLIRINILMLLDKLVEIFNWILRWKSVFSIFHKNNNTIQPI